MVDFPLSFGNIGFWFCLLERATSKIFFNIWKFHKFPANEGRIVWVRSVLRSVSLLLLTSGSSKDLRSHCPTGSHSRLAYVGVDWNSHCWWQCQLAAIITGGKRHHTRFREIVWHLHKKVQCYLLKLLKCVPSVSGCHHTPGDVACLDNKASHLTALLVLMYINCDKYQPMCVVGEFKYFLL